MKTKVTINNVHYSELLNNNLKLLINNVEVVVITPFKSSSNCILIFWQKYKNIKTVRLHTKDDQCQQRVLHWIIEYQSEVDNLQGT